MWCRVTQRRRVGTRHRLAQRRKEVNAQDAKGNAETQRKQRRRERREKTQITQISTDFFCVSAVSTIQSV